MADIKRCIITGCDKPAFCQSAWCARHALMANSKHQPDLEGEALACVCQRAREERPQ